MTKQYEFKCMYGVGNKYQPLLVVCKSQKNCRFQEPVGRNTHYCKIPLMSDERLGELERELGATE